MTAVKLNPEQRDAALSVAREIGATFRAVRIRRGDAIKNVAAALDLHQFTIHRFEDGDEPNVKLGNVMRLLRLYGMTLVVADEGRLAAAPRHGEQS